MIGGALLVLSGFIGFALSRDQEVETDPAPVPSDTNKSRSTAGANAAENLNADGPST
jgi:hypothetical protein